MLTILVALCGAGLLYSLISWYRSSPPQSARIIRRRIADYLEEHSVSFIDVIHFEGDQTEPEEQHVCVIVTSDAQCEMLEGQESIISGIKGIILESDSSDRPVRGIVVSFASQETVDRDYGGQWHAYFK